MKTRDDIKKMFNEHELEGIVNNFTRAELAEMYLKVYGIEPASNHPKKRLAQDIKRYFDAIDRAISLKP